MQLKWKADIYITCVQAFQNLGHIRTLFCTIMGLRSWTNVLAVEVIINDFGVLVTHVLPHMLTILQRSPAFGTRLLAV